MSGLDRKRLLRFLELAGDRLRGDWVVIGGCVLPLRGVEHRFTLDIDVAGPEDAGTRETLILMEIAEEIGLPVEAINQAGALFIRRIRGWQENLIEIRRGPTAAIHVPNATLFLLLKIGRLTETDLSDCLVMLDLARNRGEPVDEKRLLTAIKKAAKGRGSPDRKQRLIALSEAVSAADGDG